MIILARTPEGMKTKVYYKDGTLCELPISSFNTETSEITYYVMQEDDEGSIRVKMSEWVYNPNTKLSQRIPVTKTEVIEGSYAEIDGKRV